MASNTLIEVIDLASGNTFFKSVDDSVNCDTFPTAFPDNPSDADLSTLLNAKPVAANGSTNWQLADCSGGGNVDPNPGGGNSGDSWSDWQLVPNGYTPPGGSGSTGGGVDPTPVGDQSSTRLAGTFIY